MNRIKEIRIKNNLSQKELAEHLNTSQANVSGWECGKWQPPHHILVDLAYRFDVSIDYLLGYDSKKNINLADLDEPTIQILNVIKKLSTSNKYYILGLITANLFNGIPKNSEIDNETEENK